MLTFPVRIVLDQILMRHGLVGQWSEWLLWLGGACLTALVILFVVLYVLGTFRTCVRYQIKNVPGSEEHRFPLALVGISDSLLTQGSSTGFWIGADAIYATRLAAIRSAQRTVHFETFYMTPGRRAQEFAAAIIEQARSGVKVQLIVDSYGTKTMSERYWQQLRAVGVEIRFFSEFHWASPLDYLARTHRKLLLIDGEMALVGGAGISDEWDGTKKIGDTAPWLDIEVRFGGTVVTILEGVFMQQWAHTGGMADLGPEIFDPPASGSSRVLVTPGDDPSYKDSSIGALFYTSVLAARKRLWIASPYFLPNLDLREALLRAQKNQVDVRILTNSLRSNKKFVCYASRELYGHLLKSGIQLYEYQPSMMHAKVMLIDRYWVSTGSANLDSRSAFHNDELHISMAERKLASQVERFFLAAFAKSQHVTLQDWQTRPVWERVRGRLVLPLRWHL